MESVPGSTADGASAGGLRGRPGGRIGWRHEEGKRTHGATAGTVLHALQSQPELPSESPSWLPLSETADATGVRRCGASAPHQGHPRAIVWHLWGPAGNTCGSARRTSARPVKAGGSYLAAQRFLTVRPPPQTPCARSLSAPWAARRRGACSAAGSLRPSGHTGCGGDDRCPRQDGVRRSGLVSGTARALAAAGRVATTR